MDGVLGYVLQDMEQGITELLDSLRSNLAESDGPKHNVPEKLPIYSRHMRPGIVVRQEKPRTHCTSAGPTMGPRISCGEPANFGVL
ncbi:hypothetical protein KUCAC02_005161 [Chaenocephalus aceratus]|uniref:Uncharacterized protein n=1 Tax=Chaenocephalus aceratus TaxID=36190 RepID=A0ACB9WMK9_CHAAC|nr:hypothetical protein KUCAC02_005161 [Chaenocephalus aceratus]